MLIGHSQGGIQTVKVLHQLAGTFGDSLRVWNPITNRPEDRTGIVDPLTGRTRPVVGLKVSYAVAAGAGGITRLMPNQLSMWTRLRRIPDTVEEFTGYFVGVDILGGDPADFGEDNNYRANGEARVRTVRLPIGCEHYLLPTTKHLAERKQTRDWINEAYVPSDAPAREPDLECSTWNILWAADVWTSIKRHWVGELKRLIRARRELRRDD